MLFEVIATVQMNDSKQTVHKLAAFNSDDAGTAFDAPSIRRMNMAEAAAAAMLHQSPTFKLQSNPSLLPMPPPLALSSDNSTVPQKAMRADANVEDRIFYRRSKTKRMGPT